MGLRWLAKGWAASAAAAPVAALLTCGPLPGTSYQACATLADNQNRCTSLSERQRAANQNECERQIKLGLEGCAEAYNALAQCLPHASCASQQDLTSPCTELAGNVAARCAPSPAAANSNTVNTRGSVNLH